MEGQKLFLEILTRFSHVSCAEGSDNSRAVPVTGTETGVSVIREASGRCGTRYRKERARPVGAEREPGSLDARDGFSGRRGLPAPTSRRGSCENARSSQPRLRQTCTGRRSAPPRKAAPDAAGFDQLAQGIRAMTSFARQDLAGRVAMAWHSSRQNPVFGVFEGCIKADLARRGVSEAQKTCHKTAMSATQCQARKRHSELERSASCAVAEGVRLGRQTLSVASPRQDLAGSVS